MIIRKNNFIFEIENLLIIVLISFFVSVKIKVFLTSYFVCYLFIIFHESAHILVATLFNKKILKIKLSLAGACVTIEKKRLNKGKEIIIYFAGPIANFCLALLFKNVDMVFEINTFLGILNLLPVYPLDGYNIMSLLIKNDFIYVIQTMFFYCIFIISVVIFILTKNPSLFIFSIYIFVINHVAKSGQNG